MVHRTNPMDFLCLGHLPCPVNECPSKPTLPITSRPVRDEQGVLRELRTPGNNGCQECRVQMSLRRVRSGARLERELKPGPELRGIEKGEPCVTDLEEDFDEVEREPRDMEKGVRKVRVHNIGEISCAGDETTYSMRNASFSSWWLSSPHSLYIGERSRVVAEKDAGSL